MDEFGAHVASTGGPATVHGRAAELDSVVLQMFTKPPQRWAEPRITDEQRVAFEAERERHGIRVVVAHGSYLPNLATPDRELFEKSYRAEVAELERCGALGIDYLVDHPGNATDGDKERGLAQNAEAIGRALLEAGGSTVFLIEVTAGAGNVLGSTFEELARMIELIPEAVRDRVGVCLDTAHLYAAGYDLVHDYDGVMDHFGAVIGFDRLKALHLNDVTGALGSHRDRHAWIGDGELGLETFRRIVRDPRLLGIPKLIETPKGKDPTASDRENLSRLRGLR